ncbi:MAG: DUF6677 family protein [Planctomycetaceae bacterium]
MSDPRIPLKNPLVAALLAFLIPGAGHLYQGRFFKAVIYAACVLGSFTYGMYISEWKAVYRSPDPRKRNLGYYAQAATGLPALYAFVQTIKYRDSQKVPNNVLDAPLSEAFKGILVAQNASDAADHISGYLELEPTIGQPGGTVRGTFRGTLENGQSVEYRLGGGNFFLGPKVGGDPGRELQCGVVEEQSGGNEQMVGRIEGTIPRKFLDWFEAPLEEDELQDLNRRMGKRYELALVYTWIAGLLNILAVWDALEGPAYGYGDEEEEELDSDKKKQPEKKTSEKTLEAAKS